MSATTLGRFCADLGPELIEIRTAPRGLDATITNVWLHDRIDPIPASRGGGLLLLSGTSPEDNSLESLLQTAAGVGVSAVACRALAAWPQRLLDASEELGVALLTVPSEVGWGELYELAHAATVADAAHADDRVAERSALPDLSATAEALAAIAGGSVTIDDVQWRVLAFSGGGKIDEMRMASILNRRLPEQWLREMRQRGVIEQLLGSEDVIHVNLGETQPRRAIAIRLGRSVLGSIWLAGHDEELSDDADDALRRAAPIAALQLTRQRVADSVERRMRESALATLLRGGEASALALEQMPVKPDERFVVLVVEVTQRGTSSPIAVGPRLIDLVTMHLRSYDRRAVATSLDAELVSLRSDELIHVLTNSRGAGDREALARISSECLEHATKTLGVGLRAGIGHEVDSVERLSEARRTAEDCLALGPADKRVVLFEEVRDRAMLSEIEEFVVGWRADPSPAYTRLVEHDEAQGTEYVQTLRCLLDAFGNAAQVAERLHIHPNTVRYRIKRITEISGVDIADGDARLALELTLRALSAE